jgi:hypothetical protein
MITIKEIVLRFRHFGFGSCLVLVEKVIDLKVSNLMQQFIVKHKVNILLPYLLEIIFSVRT